MMHGRDGHFLKLYIGCIRSGGHESVWLCCSGLYTIYIQPAVICMFELMYVAAFIAACVNTPRKQSHHDP